MAENKNKDVREDLRHKVLRYIMEVMVRRKSKFTQKELNIILNNARRIETKIFMVATKKEDYCQRARLKLLRLNHLQQDYNPAANPKDITVDALRMEDRTWLGDMMLDLSLEYERDSSDEVAKQQATIIAHQEKKFRTAHNLRLKQEDAVRDPMSPPLNGRQNMDLKLAKHGKIARKRNKLRLAQGLKLNEEDNLEPNDDPGLIRLVLAHDVTKLKEEEDICGRMNSVAEDLCDQKSSLSSPSPAAVSFEDRDDVCVKLQELRKDYLSDLEHLRDILIQSIERRETLQELRVIISWVSSLNRMILCVNMVKRELPNKFKPGTMGNLERRIKSTVEFLKSTL